jgi:hypothetical protein
MKSNLDKIIIIIVFLLVTFTFIFIYVIKNKSDDNNSNENRNTDVYTNQGHSVQEGYWDRLNRRYGKNHKIENRKYGENYIKLIES